MSETLLKPIIILAFANDKDDYLQTIVRERESIYQSLLDYHDRDYINVHKQESTSIDAMFNLFNRYSDQIAILHYGGHANGTHLQLEAISGEQQMAHAAGLAQLMGRLPGLKLVFLNGCATYDQVALLFAAGVKAVIATAIAIGDEKATQFAEKFYAALAAKKSIQAAFADAKDFMIAQDGDTKKIGEYRAINWRNKPAVAPQMFEWGLYINENAGDVLEWKLPDVRRKFDFDVTTSSQAAAVNQILIDVLSKELPKHSRKMAQFLEALDSGEEDKRELPLAIIDSFPLPVGEQLRKLFSPELSDFHVPRLQQLVVTYETVVELLGFIMLSQLWEDRHRNPKLTISSQHHNLLQNYCDLHEKSYSTFNHIDLMAAVVEVFRENHLEPFVEEFKNLTALLQQEKFRQAQQFLENLRPQFHSEKIAEELKDKIKDYCLQAEQSLGTIMAGFAFIVKYRLMTIKEIKIIKDRYAEPKYRHTQVLLTRTTGQNILMDTKEVYASFADSESVILLKSVKELDKYLSLSPFVIDENALTGNQNSKLFFYTFRDAARDCYYFQFIGNRKDPLMISAEQHPLFKRQFEAFRQAVLQA